MRSYDKFTILLCTSAAVAYGAARYYDLEPAPDDLRLEEVVYGRLATSPKVDEAANSAQKKP